MKGGGGGGQMWKLEFGRCCSADDDTVLEICCRCGRVCA